MTSPDSRAQKGEDAGRNKIHPILATTWCEILRNGIQPYRQIVNADPSNNDHSSRTITSNTDLPVMYPFEHPSDTDLLEELDVVEPVKEDILALRKYRSWMTDEVERHQATRKADEAPRRREAIFILLQRGKGKQNQEHYSPQKKVTTTITGTQTIEEFVRYITSREVRQSSVRPGNSKQRLLLYLPTYLTT